MDLNTDINEKLDVLADKYAREQFDKQKQENQLLADEILIEKLKAEYLEAVKMVELGKRVKAALETIRSEGQSMLEPEDWEKLDQTFSNMEGNIPDHIPDEWFEKSFQELLGISDEIMKIMEKIALIKDQENDLSQALNIFLLITILNPTHTLSWYRLGMIYQSQNEFAQAATAYQSLLSINHEQIGPHLFLAECLLELGEKEQAISEMNEAKKIIDQGETQDWQDLFQEIEGKLQQAA